MLHVMLVTEVNSEEVAGSSNTALIAGIVVGCVVVIAAVVAAFIYYFNKKKSSKVGSSEAHVESNRQEKHPQRSGRNELSN